MAVAKERAVRKAALSDPSAAARAKFRFATFSHGSRGCPGYGFATMQVRERQWLLETWKAVIGMRDMQRVPALTKHPSPPCYTATRAARAMALPPCRWLSASTAPWFVGL